MLDYNLFKPIRNLGLLLMAIALVGFICFTKFYNASGIYFWGIVFIGTVSILYFFMGYSIVSRNRLGFTSLKICLYLLYPCYPLGYYYAKKAFEYIKKNRIEEFFTESLKV